MSNLINLGGKSTEFYIGEVKARIYLGPTLIYPIDEPTGESFLYKRHYISNPDYVFECDGTTDVSKDNIMRGADNAKYESDTITGLTFGECCETITDARGSITSPFKAELTGSVSTIKFKEGVKSINNQAFYRFYGLRQSLVFPNSLESIGDEAFRGCSGFTGTVTFGEGLKSIGNYAFHACSGMTGGLTFPNSLESIGNYAFYQCSGITGTVSFGNNLKSIGERAFDYTKGITGGWIIPDSVETIGKYSLCDKPNMHGELKLGSGLTSIGEAAFSACTGLTGHVVVPSGVTDIESYVFNGCSSLNSIVFEGAISDIHTMALYGCSSLEYIKLPNAVVPPALYQRTDITKEIGGDCPIYIPCDGYDAYMSNTYWKRLANRIVTLDDCGTHEKMLQLNKTDGTSLSWPCDGTGLIDEKKAVLGMTTAQKNTVNKIIIGDCCETIDVGSFSGFSSVNTILEIPSSVKEIKNYAFSGCTKFEKVYVYPEVPPTIGTGVFSGSFKIYVPDESFETYQTAPNWKTYASRMMKLSEDNAKPGAGRDDGDGEIELD